MFLDNYVNANEPSFDLLQYIKIKVAGSASAYCLRIEKNLNCSMLFLFTTRLNNYSN